MKMLCMEVFLVVLALDTVSVPVNGAGDSPPWSYNGADGPSAWSSSFPACGYRSQSPIDVNTDTVLIDSSRYTPIAFTGYRTNDSVLTMSNTGHGVRVMVNFTTSAMTISEGMLPETYDLLQFHLHWGETDDVGSEHRINGRQYPMELHLVHWDANNYPNISVAQAEPNGLAVIGVFVEVGDTANPVFQQIVDRLSAIPNKGDEIELPSVVLEPLLPSSRSSYIRYTGSLTTPPCYESVVWTVLQNTITISRAQMNAFRSGLYVSNTTLSSDRITNNYRPTLAVNGRWVYANYDVTGGASIPVVQTAVVLFSITFRKML